jgi:hypothetical protein
MGTFIAEIAARLSAHYDGVVEPKVLGMPNSFKFFI